MRGPIIDLDIRVSTEAPSLQRAGAIMLRLESRSWYRGNITTITLELIPSDSGRAMIGPAEARELARYLTALAATLEIERSENV